MQQLFRNRRFLPVVTVLAVMLGCGEPPPAPEEAVRQWVEQAELAAEARDRPALMDLISSAYEDARGNARADIDRLFRLYFLRQNNITLLIDIEDIQIHGTDIAEVTLTAGMAATNQSVLGFSADAWRFELQLRAEDGDWLLLNARWGELGSELR